MAKIQAMKYQDWKGLKCELAEAALAELEKSTGKHELDINYVASCESMPCVYQRWSKTVYFVCKPYPAKPVPKKFRSVRKLGVTELTHINESGCPFLTLDKVVHCFAETYDGFYYTTHKVGSCPWKTVEE